MTAMRSLIIATAILLCGCAPQFRAAAPGRRATTSVQKFRRVDRETRWIVTVNNPTDHDVFIDCEEARIRIPAHVQTDVLLMPDDVACDLKNDVEYGALPARMHRRHGPRMHWSTGS